MADRKSEMTVQSKAETIQNEKTKKQNQEAREIEKRRKEAEKKADQARQEAENERLKKEEEKRRIEEEKRLEKLRKEAEEAQRKLEEDRKALEEKKKQQALLAAGGAVAGTALLSAGKGGSFSSFIKGLLAGILVGAIGCFFLMRPAPQEPMPAPAPIEEADVVIDNDGFLGYTAADFEEAVLDGASEHQELIVMEQPLSISTTITKAGLGNFSAFSKMKDVTYYGTGVYTVDLSHIDKDHISVDETGKTVFVTIPHAVLQYVNTEVDRTEFEDTEKGILAFGDIKLTAEETKQLETAVYDSMHERLTQKDLYEEADRFAILKTWEIFQPLITAVSPEFKVEIAFES